MNSEAEKDLRFNELASSVRRKAVSEIKRHRKLLDNLAADREKHGDPALWKRFGDILLASASSARREGDKVFVIDLFDEKTPTIEIEGEARSSIAEIAEEYFRKYTKARNGMQVIARRTTETEGKLKTAEDKLLSIDTAIEEKNEEYLLSLIAPPKKPIAVTRKKKQDTEFKGARRFVSSDGFEILIGKRAADNDFLTFRVAKSLDTWMHAADYPGSHVVIRSAGKKKIPDKTLIEAAQLAAFYSDAREQTKAAVHYTLKKFVNKPKRAAPGKVSLASFKTLLVEPQVPPSVSQN